MLLDPVSEIARQEIDPSGGPSQAATLSSAASIDPLMKSWGVAIDPRFVIGDGQRALALLESNADDGLSTEQARVRLEQHGRNVLPAARRRGALRLLISQFADVLVLVLIGAAVVAVAGLLGALA